MGISIQQGLTASGGTSMTLLGTLTTTSGTTQSLTGIGAGYREIYGELEGVSFTTASALTLATSSTNGAAYGTAGAVSVAVGAAAGSYTGRVAIINIGSTVANAKIASSALWDTNGTINRSVTAVACPTNTAAVVDAIQFAGGTFDAGTIRIYGVK